MRPGQASTVALFRRNGYVRVPNAVRQERDGRAYRKGWEVRIVVPDQAQAAAVTELARQLGYSPGRAFRKHHQHVVPIYGSDAVEAFLRARGHAQSTALGIDPGEQPSGG